MGFGVELYISKSRTSKANSLMQYTYTDMHTYISVHRAPPDVAAVFGYLVSISVLVLFPLWLLPNTHTHTHTQAAGRHTQTYMCEHLQPLLMYAHKAIAIAI